MVFKTAEDNAHMNAVMEKTAMRSIVIGLIKTSFSLPCLRTNGKPAMARASP